MLLGIDASRCVASYGTGVEAYSSAIIQHLLEKIKSHPHGRFDRVHLYTPHPLPTDFIGGRFPFVEERVISLPRLWTQVRLSAEMLSEPPDVLFIPGHVLPIIHPRKSVVMIHDVAFMAFPQVYTFTKRMYLKFTTWLGVREAAKLLVPSQVVADDLVRYFSCPREKIQVVHHGFEMPGAREQQHYDLIEDRPSTDILESFGLTSETPYIFYVGRLEEKKNLARLIEAFLQFHETHPTWKLVLAGSRGFGFKQIFEIVEKRDAWNAVIMPGYITDTERADLYRQCRFTAFVSLAEGFGFPILESMSYGKDVLMSDLPIMHEVSGKGFKGTFVDPLDVSAIAAGLSSLADSTASVPHNHQDALRRIPMQYSWDRAADETLRLLESVI